MYVNLYRLLLNLEVIKIKYKKILPNIIFIYLCS